MNEKEIISKAMAALGKRTSARKKRTSKQNAVEYWRTVNQYPTDTKEGLSARTVVDPKTGCWLWQGANTGTGYGIASLNDGHDKRGYTKYRRILVHRLAWELYNGTIPPKKLVLHKCDNPPCCNPAHLFLGTHADNIKDAQDKGRFPKSKRLGEIEAKIKSLNKRLDMLSN